MVSIYDMLVALIVCRVEPLGGLNFGASGFGFWVCFGFRVPPPVKGSRSHTATESLLVSGFGFKAY